MISLPYSLSCLRSSLVLPFMRNTLQSKLWCALAAGRSAERRCHKRKDDKRRTGVIAEMYVFDSLGVGRAVAGGTQRWHGYPLSNPPEVFRAGHTWLPVEKWEGGRGRVAA